jgi:DNA-binding transcriptional MerR regulator
MDQSQDGLWKIGQVAACAGVSVDTVRYYERRGLVTPVRRADSGYRYYRPDAADQIVLARRLQGLGMTLDEVSQAAQAHDLGGETCDSQRWRLEAVRDRIADQLAEWTAVLQDIDAIVASCASGDCPLLTSPPISEQQPARIQRRQFNGHRLQARSTARDVDAPGDSRHRRHTARSAK